MLLVKLSGLKVEAANVGNVYLKAYTKEKLHVVASPEFNDDRQGNVMVIIKALYGLPTSGVCFHEK